MPKTKYTMRYTGPADTFVPGIPRSGEFEVEGAAERDRLVESGNVKWVDQPEEPTPAAATEPSAPVATADETPRFARRRSDSGTAADTTKEAQ